jgi:hypothetical protein
MEHPTGVQDSVLQVDDELDNTNDSTFGEDDQSVTSQSLRSSIYAYRFENGRSYHGYADGAYPIPNDEQEQDRLDLQHHLFKMVLNGELTTADLPSEPKRVLGTLRETFAQDANAGRLADLWVMTRCRNGDRHLGNRSCRSISRCRRDWDRSQSDSATMGASQPALLRRGLRV